MVGFQKHIRASIVVSIPACHAGDRGSIPRHGEVFFRFYKKMDSYKVLIISLLGFNNIFSYGPGNGLTPSVLLILEKCESDLHTALKNGKLHSLKKRVRIAADIAAGLRYLHSFGLIHRDIKLKNILLNQQHNAKISDMGFCRPSAVTEGSIVGTPIHMPPEIFAGNYDQSVDIYAFGILLWYLLRNSCRLPTNFEYCIDKEMLWREVLKGIRPEKISGVNRK